MNQEIIYSLKPQFIDLIIKKEKDHEFRNIKPKILPKRLWFYITSPDCKLMYLAEVGDIVEQPNKILTDGYGNKEFNSDPKFSKFAYPIKSLSKIKRPLDLETLRKNFGFTAPQSFTYISSFPQLYTEVLENIGLERIF